MMLDFKSKLREKNSSSASSVNHVVAESKKDSDFNYSSSSSAVEVGGENTLKKQFSFWSILGVGFGLTNSWCGISASMVAGISVGGCMTVVYGILIIACVSVAVAITLSELTSAIPNAGGQYVWTKVLAPRKHAPFWSFLCGQLAWVGSVFTVASMGISLGTMITAMYSLTHPDYVVKTWHVFVAAEVLHWFTFIFNCYQGWLTHIAAGALYCSITSWLVITITVLACSKGEFQPASFVFKDFDNQTGWSNNGIAFITGLINPAWSFSCLDSATHMAEEVINPQKVIPQSIMSTVAIGFVTSFTYVVAIFFCIKDITPILTEATGFPVMDIYYQVLQNKAGAIVLASMVFCSLLGCNIQCHTWQQRLCWSFARDNGIWGSKYWSRVDQRTGVPLNAHIFSNCLVSAILCIYLGSTTAYNALVTGCITFLVLSYAIPTVFLLMKKRQIKKGPFWTGKVGYIANVGMLLWALFCLVFFSFPFVMPAEQETMNYASCATVGVILYSVIYWVLRGKKHYIMRDEEVELHSYKANELEA